MTAHLERLWLNGKGREPQGVSVENAARDAPSFVQMARLKLSEDEEDPPKGVALGQRQAWTPSLLTPTRASLSSGSDDRSTGQAEAVTPPHIGK